MSSENTTNFLNKIIINNFKSIKHCEIDGCKRINLFIGRPNVGKSNILEALSLFTIPFLRENTSKSITQLIRLENETELFYNGDYENGSFVEINNGAVRVFYNKHEGLSININTESGGGVYSIDEKLNLRTKRGDSYTPFIRKYSFQTQSNTKKSHSRYLIPPFGHNIFNIIEQDGKLKGEIADLFKEYRLNLVFDKASQTLKIMKMEGGNEIFLVPYNSIADTLQRIIFFMTAVSSNDNSVLLFEEPEAHSFPPYITHITQEMIHKKNNQYFVATHSPFILNDFLENSLDELTVFMVHYENHETKLKKLSDSDLHSIYQNGVDLFTNSESFI